MPPVTCGAAIFLLPIGQLVAAGSRRPAKMSLRDGLHQPRPGGLLPRILAPARRPTKISNRDPRRKGGSFCASKSLPARLAPPDQCEQTSLRSGELRLVCSHWSGGARRAGRL